MHTRYGSENILGLRLHLVPALELMGEHVQQNLGVRVCIYVPQVFFEKVAAQLFRVGKIAVVSERETIGTIHIKGLCERRT